MKKLILILLLLSLVIILYGCTTQPEKVPVQEDVKEVKVIASCEDNNPCTNDIFNELTQQCEHKRQDHCCGDRVCDAEERCNAETHQTTCPSDCPRECPAFLTIKEMGCKGSCTKTDENYIVNGDAKISFEIRNLGELSLNNIISTFKCNKQTGKSFVAKSGTLSQSGVTFKDYFEENLEKTYLSGAPYAKPKSNYTLHITGITQEEILLDCNIQVSSLGNGVSQDFKVKLSQY